jgi:GNAT superfamily N-acetyltransferase
MPDNETRAVAYADSALRLRPEREADEAFRFTLFCCSRPPGEAFEPFDPALREMLLRQQFRAQTLSYRVQYPNARFDIVELDGAPVGRLVVDRAPPALLIVDIALDPACRNRGLGEALMRDVIDEGRAAGLPVRGAVFASNPGCLRLCLRLGFKPLESSDLYSVLEWTERR